MDLNLQIEKKNASVEVTQIPAKLFLSKTFHHLWKRQQYSILFDVKNMTLHFVDLERSLKSFLTSQNVVCLLTVFSSEEKALNVLWLIVHVHRNEKRVNDLTQ